MQRPASMQSLVEREAVRCPGPRTRQVRLQRLYSCRKRGCGIQGSPRGRGQERSKATLQADKADTGCGEAGEGGACEAANDQPEEHRTQTSRKAAGTWGHLRPCSRSMWPVDGLERAGCGLVSFALRYIDRLQRALKRHHRTLDFMPVDIDGRHGGSAFSCPLPLFRTLLQDLLPLRTRDRDASFPILGIIGKTADSRGMS